MHYPLLLSLALCCVTASLPLVHANDREPTLPGPPMADARPHSFTHHGITIEDPYAWLYDPDFPQVDDPQVVAYLEAENAYFEQAMAPLRGLQDTVFAELKGRVKEEDSSVPVRDGQWLYHWRFEPGAQYRKHLRSPAAGGEPRLIFDEGAHATEGDYYRLAALEPSPDGTLLAFSEDFDGSERHLIRVKKLADETLLADDIPNSSGSVVWTQDGEGFYYVELSPRSRPYRVMHHRLGTPPGEDRLVYEESDKSFFVGIELSQSRDYLFIHSGDHITSEMRMIPAQQASSKWRMIAPRRTGVQYEVDHADERLFIRVNDRHKNFRIVTADPTRPGPGDWQELIGPSDERYIRGITSFRDMLVVQERIRGQDRILIYPYVGQPHHVEFPESVYTARLGANTEYAVSELRLHYESMVTPDTVYDYALESRELKVRKVREIPSGYDRQRYETRRLMATARDGAQVPISIVYKKGFKRDGKSPLHLHAYGAYGHGLSPTFSSNRVSLLDRGFAFAIAHVRGGDDMGYHWYEDGKLFRRWNTFNDFVDCARFLVDQGYAAAGNISISGGSAGGELMGVVANTAPELWRVVVAHVPFVDVLNTMLNDALPLTPLEWPEWGNPLEDPAAFAYIRSYSPYDNVARKAYPPMLVTGGINDRRVTYWEPAKWVARLRSMKTDDQLLLLKINMGAGHGGKSGRYRQLEETAQEYTFILNQFGQTQ